MLGAPLISPSNGLVIGGPESVKILGVRGVLCMWQIVFALCHCLKSKNNNKNNNNKKGCLMVLADPSDLGHGKKGWRGENKRAKILKF